jgi:hypothetical protein
VIHHVALLQYTLPQKTERNPKFYLSVNEGIPFALQKKIPSPDNSFGMLGMG